MYVYMHHDSGEGCRRPYRIACHFISCLYSFENIQKGGVFKLYRVIIGWDHFDLALISGRQILECPLCLARLNPKTTCWNSLGWSLCGQLKRQSFVVYFRKQGFAIASNCNSTGWDMIFLGGNFKIFSRCVQVIMLLVYIFCFHDHITHPGLKHENHEYTLFVVYFDCMCPSFMSNVPLHLSPKICLSPCPNVSYISVIYLR
jgi:hypothetical protein